VTYVDFPNALPARIAAFSTPSQTLPRAFPLPDSPDSIRSELYTYFLNKGILIGNCEVLVHVEPLDYMAKLQDGSYEYVWKGKTVEFPVEMIMMGGSRGSHLDLPGKREEREEFRVGERVVSLQQSAYGMSGVVVEYRDGAVYVGEQVCPPVPPTPVGRNKQDSQRFYPLRELSRSLSVSKRTVTRFVENFKVKYCCEGIVSMFDFGLDLTSYNDYYHLEGWSRWNSDINEYEYCPDVLEELKLYKQQFSRLWNRMEELQGARIGRVELIFPDLTEPIEELRRISLFVSGLPSSQVQWTPYNSVRATLGQIAHIRDYMSRYRPSIVSTITPVNPAVLISSQSALIRPAFSGKFRFSIGDLVVNISDKEVPYVGFGKLGVVIGVFPHHYVEVIFQTDFGLNKDVTKVVRAEALINTNETFVVPIRKKAGEKPVGKVGEKAVGKAGGKNWAAKMVVQKPKEVYESPASLDLPLSSIPAPLLNPSAVEFTPTSASEAPDSFSLPPPSI